MKGPNTIVTLRDGIGKADETRKMTEESLKFFLNHGECPQFMVVVQGKQRDWDDWLIQYNWAASLHPRYIAFPRFLGRERVYLIELLQQCGLWRHSIRHHAFGMVAGDLAELPILNKLGVYSIDSSAPVWRGLHGYDFNKWYFWERIPEDVDIDTSNLNHTLAFENLARVLQLCQLK